MSNATVENLDDAPYFWSLDLNIDVAGCKDIILNKIHPYSPLCVADYLQTIKAY